MKTVRQVHLSLAALIAGCMLHGPLLAAPVKFSIPAGDAAQTLKTFGAQAKLQMLFLTETVEKHLTAEVNGQLEPRDALKKLLSGTGLTFEFVNERTVTVKKPGSAPVNALNIARAEAAPVMQEVARGAEPPVTENSLPPSAARKTSDATEVTVTGSRIRTLNTEATALPVYSLTRQELERRGVNRLSDLKWAVPQLGGTSRYSDFYDGFKDNRAGSAYNNSDPSVNNSTTFDLRGLGNGNFDTTLVLVNGRRVPHTGMLRIPGGPSGRGLTGFNVDGIPVSAIERIDVLPQGAGAIYGAEAVAGVINIILKEDYSGLEMRASYDTPFDTDASQKTISMNMGYRQGRFNSNLMASYEDVNSLAAADRWFTASYDRRVFGAAPTDSSVVSWLRENPFSGSGGISSIPVFAGGVTTEPNLPGLSQPWVGLPSGSNGTTATNNAYTLTVPPVFDAAPYANLIDPSTSYGVSASVDYEILDGMQVYASGRWNQYENSMIGTPVYYDSFRGVNLPAGYPGNPFNTPVVLRKIFWDLPRAEEVGTQQNLGADLGLRGEFLTNWRYDVTASWSRNEGESDEVHGASFNGTLVRQAMFAPDATPNTWFDNTVLLPNPVILAYDSLNGTDPNAPGLIAGLISTTDRSNTSTNIQYSATVDGPIWSGWAGDWRTALRAEWNREQADIWSLSSTSTTGPSEDQYVRITRAVSAELRIPLLSERQNLPLVHRLEIGGAWRAQESSDINRINVPSYNALYQPVKWMTLRASFADGFRPPYLNTLRGTTSDNPTSFSGRLTAAHNVFDDAAHGNVPLIGQFIYRSGPNPDLLPEANETRNVGVLIDVPGTLFEGLSLSADYYEIETEQAIQSIQGANVQVLIDDFPDRIIRNPATGAFMGWNSASLNIGRMRTSGWDYRLNYTRPWNGGTMTFNASMSEPNAILRRTTVVSPWSSRQMPRRGTATFFWNRGSWDAGLSINYQQAWARTFFGENQPSGEYVEFNPRVSYDFSADPRFSAGGGQWWSQWLADSQLSLTIINALDEDPTLEQAATGLYVMDQRLRRYIVSFTKSF